MTVLEIGEFADFGAHLQPPRIAPLGSLQQGVGQFDVKIRLLGRGIDIIEDRQRLHEQLQGPAAVAIAGVDEPPTSRLVTAPEFSGDHLPEMNQGRYCNAAVFRSRQFFG